MEQQGLFGRGRPEEPAGGSTPGHAPLPYRLRPRTLDEFVGQRHLLAPGRLLRRLIEADRVGSIILVGPPGCGKTALAELIARHTRAAFERLNAVTAGVADVRKAAERARERLRRGQRTILFIDEIHRFNRAQQDALLPEVEAGTLILIGATTENPYFSVTAPLLSRCRVFRLEPLDEEDVLALLRRALADPERGLGGLPLQVAEEALRHWARACGGDARAALGALELAALTTPPGPDGVVRIGLAEAQESIQRPALLYDREGDQHYDTVSAFIKSMRGSDPDATLFWLARMLEAGEDPRFIARRIVIHASEDVGLADPLALVVAVAAAQAVELVGLPEARLNLAQAALYVATAPKSHAVYRGLAAATEAVRARRGGDVPLHLRDASYRGAAALGHGRGYRYPHDFPGHFVPQQYLPAGVAGGFYRPSDQGYEREVAERLRRWWGERFAGEEGGEGRPEEGG